MAAPFAELAALAHQHMPAALTVLVFVLVACAIAGAFHEHT